MKSLKDECIAAAENVLPCWCDESYASRRLEAPDCPRHNFADLTADAMYLVAEAFARRALGIIVTRWNVVSCGNEEMCNSKIIKTLRSAGASDADPNVEEDENRQ